MNVTLGAGVNVEAHSMASRGVFLDHRGTGDITLTSYANVLTTGANDPNAIRVVSRSIGNTTVDLLGGTISTQGGNAHGMISWNPTGSDFNAISADNVSISTMGHTSQAFVGWNATFNPAITNTDFLSIDVSNSTLNTQGLNSFGIMGYHDGTGTHNITVTNTDILTQGGDVTFPSHGVWAQNVRAVNVTPVVIVVDSQSTISATGDYSDGISSFNAGSGAVDITTGAEISAFGLNGNGIKAGSTSGIHAITITGGSVMGSYGDGSVPGEGAGIFTISAGGGVIDIQAGSIGALSDRAIYDDDGATAITNDGTVTGFVELNDGNDTFINNSSNSFNFRHFEDTDGDAIRDTENVAVNDFGAGVDAFTNTATGTLRLMSVEDMSALTPGVDDDTAPTAWGASGVAEYFPAVAAQARIDRLITEVGVEQGHFVNLESFANAGIITMADAETGGAGPVAGDVLVITGSATAGSDGGSVFTVNGGELHLDTVLNDGVIDDTNVLVLDNVVLGSGLMDLIVTNDGGLGAATDINGNGLFDVDEGILVIQVLGTQSDLAFSLSTPVSVNGWQYFLDQTDGQNW